MPAPSVDEKALKGPIFDAAKVIIAARASRMTKMPSLRINDADATASTLRSALVYDKGAGTMHVYFSVSATWTNTYPTVVTDFEVWRITHEVDVEDEAVDATRSAANLAMLTRMIATYLRCDDTQDRLKTVMDTDRTHINISIDPVAPNDQQTVKERLVPFASVRTSVGSLLLRRWCNVDAQVCSPVTTAPPKTSVPDRVHYDPYALQTQSGSFPKGSFPFSTPPFAPSSAPGSVPKSINGSLGTPPLAGIGLLGPNDDNSFALPPSVAFYSGQKSPPPIVPLVPLRSATSAEPQQRLDSPFLVEDDEFDPIDDEQALALFVRECEELRITSVHEVSSAALLASVHRAVQRSPSPQAAPV